MSGHHGVGHKGQSNAHGKSPGQNEVCCILKFNCWKVFMSIQKPGSRLEPYSCLESSSQEGF